MFESGALPEADCIERVLLTILPEQRSGHRQPNGARRLKHTLVNVRDSNLPQVDAPRPLSRRFRVITCPVCRTSYVANTLFCTECGLYLMESDDLATDPLEAGQVTWLGEIDNPPNGDPRALETGPLTIRLRIKHSYRNRELEVPVSKPIRLGRMDPQQDIYPEVDLTPDLALEHGVSREHACVFRRSDIVVVEDLGSTNGTFLNGERLAPFLPQRLKDGDQLQLGKLLLDVEFKFHRPVENPLQETHASLK
jgi:hypothetical protein